MMNVFTKQTETNAEFVIVCNNIDEELRQKYENLDVRLIFVDYNHENEQLDDLTGGYAVFFNIEEFKKMDINFIREITYFVTINTLSLAFFSNYELDSTRTIYDNEFNFTLDNIHEFMDSKKENKYNNIYMVDSTCLNNKYGIWDK